MPKGAYDAFMRRRELVLTAMGCGAGLVIAGCSQGPIGRQSIPVTTVYPQDPQGEQGRAWIADGTGGISHSDPELSVEEHPDRIVLTMTAYNSARPNDNRVAIGKAMRLEFALKEPRGSRRFVNDLGETIQVVPKPPG